MLAAVASVACARTVDIQFDQGSARACNDEGLAVYDFTVSLVGAEGTEQVYLDLVDEPQGWGHYIEVVTRIDGLLNTSWNANFKLEQGEAAGGVLGVHPTGTVRSGNHSLALEAFVWGDEGNVSRFAVWLEVPPLLALTIERPAHGPIEPPPPDFWAYPSGTLVLRVTARNLGAGNDRFLIQVGIAQGTPGWSADITSGPMDEGWTPYMAPNETTLFEVTVAAPFMAGDDEWATVALNGTSEGHPRHVDPDVTARIDIQPPVFEVELVGPRVKNAGFFEGRQMMPLSFTFKVRNVSPDEFQVLGSVDPGNLTMEGAQTRLEPAGLLMSPGTTEEFVLEVMVPTWAGVGNYTIRTTFSMMLSLSFAWSEDIYVLMPEYTFIGMTSIPPDVPLRPGEAIDFQILARNIGNRFDTIALHIHGVPDGWITYIIPPELSLASLESRNVTVRIVVSKDFGEAPAKPYSFSLWADGRFTPYLDNCYLNLTVGQMFRVEWMFQDLPITYPYQPIARPGAIAPRRVLNPYERDYMDITLELRNFGNGGDNVWIQGQSDDPRVLVSASPIQTLLLIYQTKLVKVHIEVPRDLPPGIYALNATAVSEDRTTAARVVPLDFEVAKVDVALQPVHTYIETSDHAPDEWSLSVRPYIIVEERTRLVFSLEVTNAGTRELPSVLVRGYDSFSQDGRTSRLMFLNLTTPPIAAGREYTINGDPYTSVVELTYWWANVTGNHTIEFMAYSSFQSDTGNDVSMVNVTVVPAKTAESGLTREQAAIAILVVSVAIIAIVAGLIWLRVVKGTDAPPKEGDPVAPMNDGNDAAMGPR